MRYICSFVWSFWFYHHIRWYLPFSVLLPGFCVVISLFRHTAGNNIIFFSFLAKSYSIECMLHIYFIVRLWMDNFFCVCDALAIVNSASKHWGACVLMIFFSEYMPLKGGVARSCGSLFLLSMRLLVIYITTKTEVRFCLLNKLFGVYCGYAFGWLVPGIPLRG